MEILIILVIVFVVAVATAGATWYVTNQQVKKQSYDECKLDCDVKLAESKAKYEKMIKDGYMTKEQAAIKMKEEVDAANAELSRIKQESEKALEETIANKNREITELQAKLQAQVESGMITQQQAIDTVRNTLQSEKDMLSKELEALKAEADRKISVPTPWVCGMEELNAPIRVNADKNIECMSPNGWDCQWSDNYSSCKNKIETLSGTYTNPHICNAEEYATPGHWCQKAKAAFGV